jgi:hypothetical protein
MPRRLVRPTIGLVSMAVFAVWLASGSAVNAQKTPPKPAPADPKVPTVKDIMLATHTKVGPLNKVPQAVKNGQWDEAAKLVQDLTKAGDDLGKATPPKKGTPDSWTKFVKAYQTDTKAVAEAVGKKNRGEFKDAFDTLNSSCRDCHAKHK